MKKVAILEPGAWGTALGILLSKKDEVSFWYENSEFSTKLSKFRENERLPGIKIPKKIFILSDLRKAIKEANLIIIASPSFNFRETLTRLKKCIGDSYVNCPPLMGIAKGIEKETLKLPSQVVEEIFGKIPYAHLSGPGFAKEMLWDYARKITLQDFLSCGPKYYEINKILVLLHGYSFSKFLSYKTRSANNRETD